MNEFRSTIEDSEQLRDMDEELSTASIAHDIDKDLDPHWWNELIITKEKATNLLPFLFFLALLGMIYIASHHYVTKHIREIDQLSNEVKELSWDYKTLKADLMLKSTQSNVAKRVDSIGLKESIDAPELLIIKK